MDDKNQYVYRLVTSGKLKYSTKFLKANFINLDNMNLFYLILFLKGNIIIKNYSYWIYLRIFWNQEYKFFLNLLILGILCLKFLFYYSYTKFIVFY